MGQALLIPNAAQLPAQPADTATLKTYKRDALKNITDKSKWNSKKQWSSNPKEAGGVHRKTKTRANKHKTNSKMAALSPNVAIIITLCYKWSKYTNKRQRLAEGIKEKKKTQLFAVQANILS